MKGLLAIEWLKIKSFRTFWILSGFFVILLPLWNYGISNGVMKFGDGNINILSQAYSFPNVWQNLGFWASIFVVFISILVIILTTNEYQYKTNRQNVIDGWTRMDFYHAKWLVVLMLSVLTTVYVFIVGVAFGMAHGSLTEFPGSIQHLFYIWVLALNYYSFSLILSIFFKRSGIAIGMFFLYSMIIETILSNYINKILDTKAGNFLPLQSSDELLPLQILKMLKTMAGMPEQTMEWSYVAISFAWILVYYFTGRQKLLRSDW